MEPIHDSDTGCILLQDIPEDTGHTLVHYLQTRQYKHLRSRRESHEAYRRNVFTYMAANYLDLADLSLQARTFMDRSVQGVNVFQALNIALEVWLLTPADRVDFFIYHLRDKIFDTLEKNPYLFEKPAFGEYVGRTLQFDKFLVWVMANAYYNRVSQCACVGRLEGPVAVAGTIEAGMVDDGRRVRKRRRSDAAPPD
ncbi:hypothetical protein SI65_01961 [Aspergillus cristatus]|uniref:Uncharacterized protein n=1 Tax=Aspergillus cristatus TaxID=573508 RepID=A0A1E3BUC0_ASPCR|nr:hypothetical protein SI65_01921 [Aspergillus cristatus]ODM24371.1 hypothetical protein SI65_01961 [Aspergillus cristatus]